MIRALIVALMLLPCVAQAEQVAPLRWGVRTGLGANVLTDRALDLTSTYDAVFAGELVFSVQPLRQKHGLDLELGVSGSGTTATAFQAYSATLNTTSLLVGARYREPLVRWLNVYGRLGATLDWSTLTLKENETSMKLSDVAFTAGVQGAVGGEWVFRIRSDDERPKVELGAFLELGWVQRFNQARFNELKPEGATKTTPERIAFQPIDAGSLKLSAPYWRVGALLRF